MSPRLCNIVASIVIIGIEKYLRISSRLSERAPIVQERDSSAESAIRFLFFVIELNFLERHGDFVARDEVVAHQATNFHRDQHRVRDCPNHVLLLLPASLAARQYGGLENFTCRDRLQEMRSSDLRSHRKCE